MIVSIDILISNVSVFMYFAIGRWRQDFSAE